DVYNRHLTINLAGEDLTPEGGQSASILITPLAEGTCTFVLPNFALDMGNGPMSLGDITVTGVTMTQEGTNINYAGNVKDMELAGGQIKADVSLTGVTTADGSAAMTINVVWNGLPITCTFNGDKTAGIDTVISDQDGPVEYFDLRGVRVNPDNLPAGIYLRRQGSKVEKLLIK
ncbi:MAG: calycin-like domain-containing protein, partial [Paramuribaculum sp.]|nr:calycin-like domain-containing protein [Paramuribaculum sp.]